MNILTFDVEDWFHILDNESTRTIEDWARFPSRFEPFVDRLLEIVAEHRVPATFFCLGWIAEKHPGVVRKIHAAGYEIGSHSYAHQLVYEQSPEAFRQDFLRSLGLLEDLTGEKVRAFRAPGFSVTRATPWAFDVLLEHGIEYDSSIFPAPRAHGGFSEYGAIGPSIIERDGGMLREFPINILDAMGQKLVFSGGGYFRLLPYPVIRSFTRRADYVMTYFHPRDFDAQQPMVPGLGWVRRFKSYYGLAQTEGKLTALLRDFEFVDVRTAASRVDWATVPRIAL